MLCVLSAVQCPRTVWMILSSRTSSCNFRTRGRCPGMTQVSSRSAWRPDEGAFWWRCRVTDQSQLSSRTMTSASTVSINVWWLRSVLELCSSSYFVDSDEFVCTNDCMECTVTRLASLGVGHLDFGMDQVWSWNGLILASAKTPVCHLLWNTNFYLFCYAC